MAFISMNSYMPIAYQYLEQWVFADRYRVDAVCSSDREIKTKGLLGLAKAYSLSQSLLLNASKASNGFDVGYTELYELTNHFPTRAEVDADTTKVVWNFGDVIGRLFPRLRAGEISYPNQLSASTKFLWFAGNERVRIFDRLVYFSLFRREAGNMTLEKYEEYCIRWDTAFGIALPEIEAAVSSLCAPQALNFLFAGQIAILANEELATEIRSRRFVERVYDRALWLHGGLARSGGPDAQSPPAELHYYDLLCRAIKVG